MPRNNRSAASTNGSWSEDPVRAKGAEGEPGPVAARTVNGVLADRPLAPVTTKVCGPGVAFAGMRTVTENAPAALARKVATTTGVVLKVAVSPSLPGKPLPDRTTSWPAAPCGGFTWIAGAPAAVVVVVIAVPPPPAGVVVVVVASTVVKVVEVDAGVVVEVVVDVELLVVVGTVVVVDVDVVVVVDVVVEDVVVDVDVVVDDEVVVDDDVVVGVVVLVVLVVDVLLVVVDVLVVVVVPGASPPPTRWRRCTRWRRRCCWRRRCSPPATGRCRRRWG